MRILSSQLRQYRALVPKWAQFTGGEERLPIKKGQLMSHLPECSPLAIGLMSPEGVGGHLLHADIPPEKLHSFTQTALLFL